MTGMVLGAGMQRSIRHNAYPRRTFSARDGKEIDPRAEEEISDLKVKSIGGKVKEKEPPPQPHPCPAQTFLVSIRAPQSGPRKLHGGLSLTSTQLSPRQIRRGMVDGSVVVSWDLLDCRGQMKVRWGWGLVFP